METALMAFKCGKKKRRKRKMGKSEKIIVNKLHDDRRSALCYAQVQVFVRRYDVIS